MSRFFLNLASLSVLLAGNVRAAGQEPEAVAPTEPVKLFNGADLTGLETWWWYEGPETVTVTVFLRGYHVTAVAHPTGYQWSFGDGATSRALLASSGGVSAAYRRRAGVAGAVAVLIAVIVGTVWFVTRSSTICPSVVTSTKCFASSMRCSSPRSTAKSVRQVGTKESPE